MTGSLTFQPPLAAVPSLGFSPPIGLSTTPSATRPEMPSAQVTQYALVTANGIGRNALREITWAEWERDHVLRTSLDKLTTRMTADRRF